MIQEVYSYTKNLTTKWYVNNARIKSNAFMVPMQCNVAKGTKTHKNENLRYERYKGTAEIGTISWFKEKAGGERIY